MQRAEFDPTAWAGEYWRADKPLPDPRFERARAGFDLERDRNPGSRARLGRSLRASKRAVPEASLPPGRKPRFWFTKDGRTAHPQNELILEEVLQSHPMRDFSRRHGQGNKPTAIWTRTNGDLVLCESLHEGRFVVLVDHDPRVAHISAQPCTIQLATGSAFATHTPDFIVVCPGRHLIVVDIKTEEEARDPKYIALHNAVRDALGPYGVAHVVVTDLPRIVDSNLCYFRGSAVSDRDYAAATASVQAVWTPGSTSRSLARRAATDGTTDETTFLIAVRQMLWRRDLTMNLSARYTLDSEVFLP